MIRKWTFILTAAAAVACGSTSASADIFDFTVDLCTGGCGTSPFGSVTLTQNGTTVDATVHLNSPNGFVKTGAGDFWPSNSTLLALC